MRACLSVLLGSVCLAALWGVDPVPAAGPPESWRLLRLGFGLEKIASFRTVAEIPAEEDSYYGLFEDGEAIDNAEELLTAAFFSRTIKLTDPALASAFARDFPHTPAGAMNLCSIWLRKKAEQFGRSDSNGNDKAQIYDGVVQQIEEPTGLVHDFVIEWYRKNIAQEIRQSARAAAVDRNDQLAVSDTQWELAAQTLIDYYQEPGKESYSRLIKQYRPSPALDTLLINTASPLFATQVRLDATVKRP